jgi:DNA-binding transcriptional regulator LsrR (DeoR family)
MHMVAKLHYESDLPQVQIARQLGLSAATISRLLQRARAEGIVRIEVRDLVVPDALGAKLERALGLRRVAVAEAGSSVASLALAAPLGTMLRTANMAPGSVLALGWGRTIHTILEAGLPSVPGVLVVPATGGMMQHQAHFQINEFARIAAQQMGGTANFVHAPVLPSAESRSSFLADPAIAQAVALWDRIDVAVVGVGLPHSQNAPDATFGTPDEQRIVGCAGDVVRHYIDRLGNLIDWDGAERLITVSPEQLRRARLCIGVAAGEAKAGAIVAATRAGLINALVTDVTTAQAVLDRCTSAR